MRQDREDNLLSGGKCVIMKDQEESGAVRKENKVKDLEFRFIFPPIDLEAITV